jgi:hypothetical protein
MDERAVVPLLEGVHAKAEVLIREHRMKIGEAWCRILLPGRASGQITRAGQLRRLGPPPHSGDWPKVDWGYVNSDSAVTVRALGLVVTNAAALVDDGLAAFDRALVRWKRLLRDWLAVLTDGPTEFLEDLGAEVTWARPEREREAGRILGDLHMPQCVSVWEWEHAIQHVRVGDEPQLARTLLTTAMRAQVNGDWRAAVIDAATAAEVALTGALTASLSVEASPRVAKALVDRTRMLGARLELARELGFAIPDTTRVELLDLRNAVMHRGVEVAASQAQAAVEVARELVNRHDPLSAHCQVPLEEIDDD